MERYRKGGVRPCKALISLRIIGLPKIACGIRQPFFIGAAEVRRMIGRSGVAWALGMALLAATLRVGYAEAGDVVRLGSITVYSPEDVRLFCNCAGDVTSLEFPGCSAWALARDESLYSPMPLDEVVEAVRAIAFPLDGLPIDVLILPAARPDLPASSAEGRVVLLSPGRCGYPREHVHYIVAHEIGHVLHHLLLPNPEDDLWRQYAALRGIDLEAARAASIHAERLDEMFAEDFRVLFGGDLARCGSGVENHGLADPESVAGLRDFFLSIPCAWEDRLRLYASPNPFVESIQVEAFGLGASREVSLVAIYDVRGRLLRAIGPDPASRPAVTWDGTLADGAPAAPGVYYAVITAGAASGITKVVKASR